MSSFDRVMSGRLVLRDRVVDNGWIAIRDGRIAHMGEGAAPSARERESFGNCWLMPGVIDGQVHSGSQANHEGLGRASRAAAAGGVTVMVDMPCDDHRQSTNADALREKILEVEAYCHVDAALYATVQDRGGLNAIRGLVEMGACAFKFSNFEAQPERFPRVDEEVLEVAFRRLATYGLLCGVHNQNQELTLKRIKRAQEAGDTGWHAWGRVLTPLIENLATATVYELGAATGARAHVVHCSLARGIELCQMHRRVGQRATVEVCAHHLTLCDEVHMRRFGARAKCYPPLRPQREVEWLWAHVAAGHVDFVSSDHLACSLDRKSDPNIFRNACGGPGLETLLPAIWTGLHNRGISVSHAAQLLCEGPAQAFGLADRKGHFAVGKDADVVVLEPGRFAYDPATSLSAVTWSAFEGQVFTVRSALTLLRGQTVWDGSAICNAPGSGSFQRPAQQTRACDRQDLAA
jgi:allantoinase